MKPFNISQFMGPKTTAQSLAEGRLKVSAGTKAKRKKILKGALKKFKKYKY